MNLLFFDTETTGLDNPRLVQLAYKNSMTNEVLNEYFNPSIVISCGAMAVHHITNEIIKDKPLFKDSTAHSKLISNLENAIPVAHNAPYDIEVLKNEGIKINTYIDTLRIAQHIVDAEQYKLQYLRYFLSLEVDGVAHDAAGDVAVLESLFYNLFTLVKTKFSLESEKAVIDKLINLTNTPVLLKIINFGKYRDKTFKEISDQDQSYLKWLYESEIKKPKKDQKTELVYTLQHYLK